MSAARRRPLCGALVRFAARADLLSCYKRLCATEAKAAGDVATASSQQQVAAIEGACFPLAVLLHQRKTPQIHQVQS